MPTWIFVCDRCYDVPQENDRVIVLPADPVPIQLPFPEDFEAAEATVMSLKLDAPPLTLMGLVDRATPMTTVSGTYMAEEQEVAAPLPVDPKTGLTIPNPTAMQTVGGVMMGPTPTGRPPGYDAIDRAPVTPNDVVVLMAQTPGTNMATVGGTYMATEQEGAQPFEDSDPLPVISMMANGTPLVTATCNAPHNLALNDQVFVRGSAEPLADGLFSVNPITATAFTYGAYSPVPSGSILGANTIVVNAKIGLPREFEQVPQTGLLQTRPSPGVQ